MPDNIMRAAKWEVDRLNACSEAPLDLLYESFAEPNSILQKRHVVCESSFKQVLERVFDR